MEDQGKSKEENREHSTDLCEYYTVNKLKIFVTVMRIRSLCFTRIFHDDIPPLVGYVHIRIRFNLNVIPNCTTAKTFLDFLYLPSSQYQRPSIKLYLLSSEWHPSSSQVPLNLPFAIGFGFAFSWRREWAIIGQNYRNIGLLLTLNWKLLHFNIKFLIKGTVYTQTQVLLLKKEER